jgi:hypothetical protein
VYLFSLGDWFLFGMLDLYGGKGLYSNMGQMTESNYIWLLKKE